MVSSIIPGTAGAVALGVDARLPRTAQNTDTNGSSSSPLDQVDLGDAALWSASRDSVEAALDQVNTALSYGDDARDFLNQLQSTANGDSSADPSQLASSFSDTINAAIKGGASLLSGGQLQVQAEPNGAPLTVSGLDLRFASPTGVFSALTNASDSDLADAARSSLASLNAGMAKLSDSQRALTTHLDVLNAAGGATEGVQSDLDADGARLLALQVRQGLETVGGAGIANAEPQAVLSLFRA